MKLITEINEDIKILTEDVGNGIKAYFIEGIFLQGDIRNQNGRVYPIQILENEVNRYNRELITQNRAFGELSHPASAVINLERASHMIKELRQDGTNFIGKAKILDTPYGKIVKNLIDEGAKLGVSSRGIGSLEERNGVNFVREDFRLSTAADIVADPSAPDAFVRGIMEGREWVYENGLLVSKEIETYKKSLINTPKRNLTEQKIKVFADFMRRLAKTSIL